jgi:hypothetical protein
MTTREFVGSALSCATAFFAVLAATFWIIRRGRTESCAGKRARLRLGRVHGRAQRQRRTGALSRNTSRAVAVEIFRCLESRWSSAVSSGAGSGFSTPLTSGADVRDV